MNTESARKAELFLATSSHGMNKIQKIGFGMDDAQDTAHWVRSSCQKKVG